MIRIIIADDHPIVRAGLKQIMAEAADIMVTAEVDNADDLIDRLGRDSIDLVLLDITMPGMDGLEALRRIKKMNADLPVLMLSMHAEEQFALRTLKAGASGYLTKNSAPSELIAAIRRVVKGKKYISSNFVAKLAAEPYQSLTKLPHERLSEREFQVLCLIGRGKSVTEIAAGLNLSVKTISTYRTRISEKMLMDKTSELVAYALKNNLC
jgi:two-component system invasion response regulator UvrY